MKVLRITFETEVGHNHLPPSDEEDIYIKDIEERFDGRNIEVKQIGGDITTPKTIYLQVCGKRDFDQLSDVTWCKDRINDSDVVYFSEDAVRETLARYLLKPQSIQEEINRLKGASDD